LYWVVLNSFYSIVISLLSYLLFGVAGETVILISSTNRHSKRVNVTWFFLPQKSPFSTLCTLLILMSVAEKMEMRVSAFYTTYLLVLF
jgi:hypothetical protein